ncbi:pentatricopeptide repeat-containing protein At2g01510, mitochondrial [Magnolia sinica]|uniref:pentatricopeptide repeat-containing protein At2g01510, mitochondrial n=1 Tax=Magnolia sinica TaxID=86752 RepID=UPI00265B5DE8|nr:pentatricopeptide repeat-containing protein At2g01510, mitochondrial [Magnolia sinica]
MPLFTIALTQTTINLCTLHERLQPLAHRSAASVHTHTRTRSNGPRSPPSNKQCFASLLNAFSKHPTQLMQIHALLLTTGLSRKNSLITSLISALLLMGHTIYPRRLFDTLHKPRTFLWNTLVRGYVKNDLCAEALTVYDRMHRAGIRPDEFTFPFVIKACAEVAGICGGPVVHAIVIKYGLAFDTIVRTELMIMYAKFGDLGAADYVFESMTDRDLISWNALITVYAQGGHVDKALALFEGMNLEGVRPDSVTLASILSACAYLGSLEVGMWIHRQIIKQGLHKNLFVDNALLDMYAKCGSMEMAGWVFDKMCQRNVVSWSTMIGGYAINGESEKALELFSCMWSEGVQPNQVTYLSVLFACSHAGLVRQGQMYFNYMSRPGSKIQPKIEHYACMVDLFGRAGYLLEAYNFITRMPIEPDSGVWGALLGACTIHQNMELGQHVADHLFSLAPKAAAYHVLMSNIYAAAGRWADVEKIRQRMKDHGVKKVAAYSSVESNGEIHVFHGGDQSHPQCVKIYEVLEELMKQLRNVGYTPRTSVVLHDVEMEEKEAVLGTHSEKLAIAFGLISLRSELPIRIMKNLRICNDCHTFSKFVSKVVGREIVMRDKNRFHHFKGGVCSCKDFW